MSIALLIARLILGLGLAAHGAQKLFGWFGGHGPKGTGDFFEGVGWRPGVLFAVAAGLGEVGGGLLLALGFLGGIGPGVMILVMLTAIVTVHLGKGFFILNGWELPGLYIAGRSRSILPVSAHIRSIRRSAGALWERRTIVGSLSPSR